ncbi:MAG: SIR2 family protein [Magnetococcales bacterium]|nr:SIR2 family protein [Magnetococcales bacterium]
MSDNIQTKVRSDAEQLVRECLAANPVVILGSGASVGLGLPTMGQLAERIVEEVGKLGLDPAKWTVLFDAWQVGEGLEAALNKAQLDEASPLYAAIVDSVWKMVAWQDVMAFEKVRAGHVLPHAKLFKYLFGSSARNVTVITPNYDRLAEYGADQGGFCHRSGFVGAYLRTWQGPTHAPRYLRGDVRQEDRTVDLLKVHGSLDWFRAEKDRDAIGLPVHASAEDNLKPPTGMRPVIVPPAKFKYAQTHFEPYRSLMTEADRVIKKAEAFLAIGFGFNDDHVQDHLTRAMRDRPKPLVMVTKSLTDMAKKALEDASKSLRYCVLTEGQPGTTMVYTDEHRTGVEIEGIDAWSFDGFANEYL